jgi:hypothetical protein
METHSGGMLDQLDENPVHPFGMNKGDPTMHSLARGLVDEGHAVIPEPGEGRLDVVDLDADVMDALSSFFQVPGDASVFAQGLYQLEVALACRQEGDLDLLVRHFCDFFQGQPQGRLVRLQSFLEVANDDADVIDPDVLPGFVFHPLPFQYA